MDNQAKPRRNKTLLFFILAYSYLFKDHTSFSPFLIQKTLYKNKKPIAFLRAYWQNLFDE